MYLLLSLHVDFDIQFSNAVKEKYIEMLYLFTSYSKVDTTYFFKPVSSVDARGPGPFFNHLKSFKGKEQSSGKKFDIYKAASAIFCLFQD